MQITRELYEELEAESQNTKLPSKLNIIDLDLRRMDIKIDGQEAHDMLTEIKKLLQLFWLYRKDIGYVQGMSYLAWMLLIRMEPFEAFCSFANIMIMDPFIQSLYFFNGVKIREVVQFAEECLRDKKPKLYKHMKNLQVES